MKSQHRHELETNWLAKRVADWLNVIQPYNSLIAGVLVAVVVAVVGFSYYRSASAARQSEAWSTYNQAVGGLMPNLETLRESAEEYPDSPVQQWADITWADGQVWLASRSILQNRSAALDMLNRATGVYQGLMKETNDERLKSRAHFGLGRIFELRCELDKAREEYGAVTGGFATLAEQRIKDLDEADAKETYAWLATAEAPRRMAPPGPGTPGLMPNFSPGELQMPAAGGSNSGASNTEPTAPMSVDDLFKGIGETSNQDDANVTDRYNSDVPPTGASDAKPEDAAADGGEPQQ
jgi:predicted negative regulator of RcsB-dependent stress response